MFHGLIIHTIALDFPPVSQVSPAPMPTYHSLENRALYTTPHTYTSPHFLSPHSLLGAKLESIILLGQHTFLIEKKEYCSCMHWANEFLVPNGV